MKTLRRLIYGEVFSAVSFVTLGFLGLFFFFDLIDELQWVGKGGRGGYQMSHALTYVTLMIPSHVYELMPIAVLIGTIFVMARLAQSSEFTILRTSGLGPYMALRHLLWLGLAFVVLTFAVGDYLSPFCDRQAQLLKSRYLGQITVGQTGAWLKEKQAYTQLAVNVQALTPDGDMQGIRVYEFDRAGLLLSLTLRGYQNGINLGNNNVSTNLDISTNAKVFGEFAGGGYTGTIREMIIYPVEHNDFTILQINNSM